MLAYVKVPIELKLAQEKQEAFPVCLDTRILKIQTFLASLGKQKAQQFCVFMSLINEPRSE